MTEWIKYTGSPEQIEELEFSFTNAGFIFRNSVGAISNVVQGKTPLASNFIKNHFEQYWQVKEYLICNPHPNADMICQQARTGQPVWIKKPVVYVRVDTQQQSDVCYLIEVTCNPDWRIPGAQYSFTPFDD